MPKFTHKLTPEIIAGFTHSGLLDMRQRALVNDAQDVLSWCDFELSKRPTPLPSDPTTRKPRKTGVRKGGRAPSVVAADKSLTTEFEKLSRSLLEKYDLSIETARELSKGFKFAGHKFDGKAKVGGAKRLGRVSINKFLSYRLKEDVFALAGVLEHNEPAENMYFTVLAPKEYVSNYLTINELIPSLEENDSLGKIYGGQLFTNFDEAAELYVSILERIAPKKTNPPNTL